MKVITRKYKLEKWKAIITNQMASGLTAAEYCRQEDLPISTFFYWKRTIRQDLIAQMDTQVSKPAIVEVPLTVSETPLEEAPPAPPIEQNKLTLKCEYTGPKKPPIRRFGNRESGIKKPLLSDFLVCRFWARGNHHSRE
jgi:hypothetical protein